MKKSLLVVLFTIFIAGASILFSACGKSYDDIKITLNQESLTIYLDEEENSAELVATVDVLNDSFSQSVSFFAQDPIVSIQNKGFEDGKTTVIITALNPGDTVIYATTKEGEKTASCDVHIILKASSMEFRQDAQVAVALGQTWKFSKEYLDFYPTNTNQTDVVFSLGDDANGFATIDADGNFTAIAKPMGQGVVTYPVTVIATLKDNPEISASTQVALYHAYDKSEIWMQETTQAHDTQYREGANLVIAKNSDNNSKNLYVAVPFESDAGETIGTAASYPFTATMTSSDSSILTISKVTENLNQFKLVGIDTGKVTVTVSVGLSGYTKQNWTEITFTVQVIDIVNSVYLNGSSSSINLNVYDVYTTYSESTNGTKITYSTGPTTSTYKNLSFHLNNASDADLLQNLVFTNAQGEVIDIDGYSVNSNGFLRVKATSAVDQSVTLRVDANDNFEDGKYIVSNYITINIKKGAEEIAFIQNEQFIDFGEYKNTWFEIPYYVNQTLASEYTNLDMSQLSIRVQKTNVLNAKFEDNRLMVQPLLAGTTNVVINSITGASSSIVLKVVTVGDGVQIDVDQNLYKSELALVTREEGQVLDLKANVNSSFALYIRKNPTDLTIWDLNYSSSKNIVASISQSGQVRTSNSGVAVLKVSGKYAGLDEEGEIVEKSFDYEINLQVFVPITEFSIGKQNASVYDVNSIGYLDADDYSAVYFNVVMSASYIESNAVRFAITNDAVTTRQNNDGSITYIGTTGFLTDYLDGTAKFVARLSGLSTSGSATITASVQEFDRTYSSTCTVDIVKAQTLSEIYLADYDDTGIYFETGRGLATRENDYYTDNNYQITTTIYPNNAINTGLYYAVLGDAVSPSVMVTQTGLIMPLRAGNAIVRVVPKSALIYDEDNDGILSESEIKQSVKNATVYRDLNISVADGTLDNPYRIYNAVQFLDIANGLNSHYVLASTIDLSNLDLAPIANAITPFTGSISGLLELVDAQGKIRQIYSRLLNVKLSANLEYDSQNMTWTNYGYGLFGAVKGQYSALDNDWAYASIRDLEISVSQVTFTVKNADTTPRALSIVNKLSIGVLVGQLQGKISNVKTILNGNYNIELVANADFAIGGLVGTNLKSGSNISSIQNCTIQSSNSAKINIASRYDNIKFGGVVGVNDGEVVGKNKYINGDLSENEISFDFAGSSFDVNVNLSAKLNIDSQNSKFGGVVGQNNGTVKNLSSTGSIKVISESGALQGGVLGGICGQNTQNIYDVLSNMTVYGLNSVGGIAGQNDGEIKLALFEVFDDTDSLDNILMANNIVGGVVGQNTGSIEYAYFESCRSQNDFYPINIVSAVGVAGGFVAINNGGTIDKAWSNAKIISQNGNATVGGFAGQITNSQISNAYAKTTIINAGTKGGFVAVTDSVSTISYTYAITTDENENYIDYVGNGYSIASYSYFVSNENKFSGGAVSTLADKLKVSTNFDTSWWDNYWRVYITSITDNLDGSQTIITNGENLNDGYPYILYQVDAENFVPFLSEVPEKIQIKLNDSANNKFLVVSDDETSGHKIVLFQNKDKQTLLTQNIALQDLVKILPTPAISNGKTLYLSTEIVSGSQNLSCENGILKPLNQGLAVLKIYSSLNRDAYDILQIYVTPGVSQMSVNVGNTKIDANGQNTIVSMRKDSSKTTSVSYANSDYAEVNGNLGLAWKIQANDDNELFAILNGTSDNDYQYVDYTMTGILTARQVTTSESTRVTPIVITPYVTANFLNNGASEEHKVLIDYLKQIFNLNIYEGISNLTLSQGSQSMTPNDKVQMVAKLTTDIFEYVSSINIQNASGQTVQTITIYYVDNNFEISQNSDDQTQIFEVKLNKVNDLSQSENYVEMIFEIIPTQNLYYIQSSQNYTFNFTAINKHQAEVSDDNLVESKIYSKSLNLTVNPQPVLKISMEHFTYFDGGRLTSDEASSDMISCGTDGLLKINIYPYFANADYVELISSTAGGDAVSFSQQAYFNNTKLLGNLNQSGNLIDGGIRLSLISGYNYDTVTRSYVPYFDGDLWIKTLIGSNVVENTPFTLTANVYDSNGNLVSTSSLTLYAQFSPFVTINYPESYNNLIAVGTTVNFDLGVKTVGGQVEISWENLTNPNSDAPIVTQIGDSAVYRFANKTRTETNLNASLYVGILANVGDVIRITATLTTTIDNIQFIRSTHIDVVVAYYLINGVYIQGAVSGTLDMSVNKTTNLHAKASVVKYDEIEFDLTQNQLSVEEYERQNAIREKIALIDSLIAEFESDLDKNANVWYKRNYTGATAYTDELFTQVGESLTNYSYQFINNVYVLKGKKESTDSRIALKVNLSYGYQNSVFTLYIDNSENYTISFEYPCILNIKDNSTEENPTPIYDIDGFRNMSAGNHYILMNNLVLENWEPMQANFASVDGNGKLLILNSFAFSEQTAGTSNLGIFSVVSQNTILKNLIVDIRGLLSSEDTSTLDMTARQQVYFGLLAGQNNGVITNCEVVAINGIPNHNGEREQENQANSMWNLTLKADITVNSNYTSHALGGLVGLNSGYITNSRFGRFSGEIGESIISVEQSLISQTPITIIATSNYGGLVGQNDRVISSSFVKNVNIQNVTNIGAMASTAGFVVTNGGKITASSAQGVIDNDTVVNMSSYGNIAGFVLRNTGSISDCYSNFTMKTPATGAGFVYNNLGSIKYSYTLSKFVSEQSGNNSSFRAFTGVNDFDEVQNEGTIEYCYYISDDGEYIYGDEPAGEIKREDFADSSNYVGFSYSSIQPQNGIWRFDETGEKAPELVSANNIAISIRYLFDEDSEDDIFVYSYASGYELGTKNNPILISSAENFNNYFTTSTNSVSYISDENIRIVRDLNFIETAETAGGLNSSLTIFQGTLDANGMTLSNITLTGEYAQSQEESADSTSEKMNEKDEFGLFARLDHAVIKNMALSFTQVNANEYSVVGGLAGVAVDSVIVGIELGNEGTVIQGKNIVGGLVGMTLGVTEIQNITSNLSVSATYRNSEARMEYDLEQVATDSLTSQEYSLQQLYTLNASDPQTLAKDINIYRTIYSQGLPNKKVSYAGGVIGVAILGDSSSTESQIRTVKVYGETQVSSERTGGIIAYASTYTMAYDLQFELEYSATSNYSQSLAGVYFVGGLVGELYGTVESSCLDYNSEYANETDIVSQGRILGAKNLFTGVSQYQGTLVGLARYATMRNVYSRANLINTNAGLVGLVAGSVQGGDYSDIYVSGDLLGANLGGAFAGELLTSTNGIETFDNILLTANYSFETASEISKTSGFKLGALVGYAQYSSDFENLISSVNNDKCYAVTRVSRTSQYKYEENLPYIYSVAKVVGEGDDTLVQELNEKIKSLEIINGMLTDDEIASFVFLTSDFNNGQGVYENVFADSESWVVAGRNFPLLKITHKQTAIIIDTLERARMFFELLSSNLNATFYIAIDIDMTDQSAQVSSVGSESSPFKGSIIGRTLDFDQNGKPIYPKITLLGGVPLFGYTAYARITNIDFVGANSNYTYEINQTQNALIANTASHSRFSNLTVSNIDINLALADSGENSKFGAIVGTAINDTTISNISIVDIKYTFTNVSRSYGDLAFGSVVGSATLSELSNITVQSTLIAQGLNANNINIGLVAGTLNSTSLLNISASLTASEFAINGVGVAQINIGGIVGSANSSKSLRQLEFTTSDSAFEMTVNGEISSVNIGGIGGYFVNSSVSVTNVNAEIISNINANCDSKIGGVIGCINGGNIIASSFDGNITVIGSGDQTKANVGGVVGEMNLSSIGSIDSSYFAGQIHTGKIFEMNIGGLIGAQIGNNTLSITNCYADGKINVGDFDTLNDTTYKIHTVAVGGLGGNLNMASLTNTYFAGWINLYSDFDENMLNTPIVVGGLIGMAMRDIGINTSYSNAYFNVDTDFSQVFCKGIVGSYINTPKISANTFYVLENSPQYDELANGVNLSKLFGTSNATKTWFDSTETKWTADENSLPVLAKIKPANYDEVGSIYRPIQLNASNSNWNGLNDSYYILTSDIEVTTHKENTFNGVVNGNGYKVISGFDFVFNEIGENSAIVNLNIAVDYSMTTNTTRLGAVANTNFGYLGYVSAKGGLKTTNAGLNANLGGLVALNEGVIAFSQSFVDITAYSSDINNSVSVGGIAGRQNNKASIVNSFNSGNFETANVFVGGVLGSIYGGTIDTVYVNGVTRGTTGYKGAIYAYSNGSHTITNAYNDYYSTLLISGTDASEVNNITMKDVDTGLSGFDTSIWSWYAIDNNGFAQNVEVINYGYPYLKLSSTINSDFMKTGDGSSEAKSIKIKSQSGLALIDDMSSKSISRYYVLEKSFDFVPSGVMIEKFVGTLNGAGYILNNVSITQNLEQTQNIGLIGTNSGKLKNIKINNLTLTIPNTSAVTTVGGLVALNNDSVANCTLSSVKISYLFDTTSGAQNSELNIGGMIGYNDSTSRGSVLSNVISNVTFDFKNSKIPALAMNLGGFAGYNNKGSTIQGTVVNGLTIGTSSSMNINYEANIGGFVGSSLGRIAPNESTNCSVMGTSVVSITSNGPARIYVGGFAGVNSQYISDASTQAQISVTGSGGTLYAGGFVGLASGTIRNSSSASARLTLNGSFTSGSYGGFIGRSGGGNAIQNCTSTNNIPSQVNGLVKL